MKCDRVRDMFSGYLESELDSQSSAAFEAHLSECSRCRSDYERFSATVVMLEEVPEVEPPASFHASVMARLERARRPALQPVAWWQIDWQHVFTIRVPARAVALGMAVLLLMVMVMQMTPVGPTVANIFGVGGRQQLVQSDEALPTAPIRTLSDKPSCKSDVEVAIAGTPTRAGGVYTLEVRSCSPYPIVYKLQTGTSMHTGSVASDQDSVIRVAAKAQGVVAARLTWINKGVRHAQSLFLPSRFDPKAAGKRLDLEFDRQTVGKTLGVIAQEYGIVILASGNLDTVVPYAAVESGNPSMALYDTVESTNVDMRHHTMENAPSVYVVEPAK